MKFDINSILEICGLVGTSKDYLDAMLTLKRQMESNRVKIYGSKGNPIRIEDVERSINFCKVHIMHLLHLHDHIRMEMEEECKNHKEEMH